jgi:hypothetical protein
MPAVNNLSFEDGGATVPVINNHGEIAIAAPVKNAAGKPALGVFLILPDGKIRSVALPDQDLAGGKVQDAGLPSINDAGVVGFLTARTSQPPTGAYLWEQGAITPVAVVDTETTSGAKVREISGLWVNNRNNTALVAAAVRGKTGHGLYRYREGKLSPLVVRDQEMPGGGQFAQLAGGSEVVSWANEAGQHAFYAQLRDGSRAAYLLNADGTLALVIKSGAATSIGTITRIAPPQSFGIALNSQGEVALPVQLDGGAAAVLLLTPATP